MEEFHPFLQMEIFGATFVFRRQKKIMKKFLFILLLACGAHAQQKVFNVQQYCIDEKPFKKGTCDVSGNEYSFVFLDTAKSKVTFFLTAMKLEYDIASVSQDAKSPADTVYMLKSANGDVILRLNKAQTKMEFLYPDKHIYLMVGKSTKAER